MISCTLVEEYRKCLERNCDHSVPSTCTDLKLKGLLRKSLEADPELHTALQNEDALSVIDRALGLQQDGAMALDGLVQAFEVLELAAVNLWCFPWRKEFHVIKMFSGGYVHNLKSVFFEEDISKLFRKMGYVKSAADHCFRLTQLPSKADLTLTACAFFAARVECEMLSEIVFKLDSGKVSGGDLIRERKNAGGMDDCVKSLQRLVSKMESSERKGPELHILQAASAEFFDGDIYRDVIEGPAQSQLIYSEPTVGRIDLQLDHHHSRIMGHPQFFNKCHDYLGAQYGTPGSHKCKESGKDFCDRPGQEDAEEVKTASLNGQALSSIQSPYENLDGPNGSRSLSHKIPVADIHVDLPTGVTYMLHDCVINDGHLDYSCEDCHMLHHFLCKDAKSCMVVQHRITFLTHAEKDLIFKEVFHQKYQAHTCLLKDSLPVYRCDACQVLHYIKCDEVTDCKAKKHPVHMIFRESDQKLWLQRTKLDTLFPCSPKPGSWV